MVKNDKCYILLEDVIREYSENAKVYYMPNSGNWGDSIIRYATLLFFNKTGMKFTEIKKLKELPPVKFGKRILLYGGGGGWCSNWDHSSKIIEEASRKFVKIIVLPSTYEETYSYNNTIFFVRDKFESLKNIPDALFCHDMAFFIGKIKSEEGSGDGYFFRTDSESTGKIKIPASNLDISSMGRTYARAYDFINEISKYNVIYTDRLHVAIVASLLEKELHLFSGNYFKNRAVFNTSIKPNFKNVFFHEDFTLESAKK